MKSFQLLFLWMQTFEMRTRFFLPAFLYGELQIVLLQFTRQKMLGDHLLVPSFNHCEFWQSGCLNWDVKFGLRVKHTQQSVIYERRKCLCFISLSLRRYYVAITCCESFGECFARAFVPTAIYTLRGSPVKMKTRSHHEEKLILRDSLKYARLLLLSRFI